MRRLLLLAAVAALTAVPTASAAFRPIHRDFGELTFPKVRAGHVTIPSGHRSGRLRVIVSLKLPPLAQAYGRGLYAAGSAQRLNVRSATSRAYLRRIQAEQSAAIAQLHRALPAARVSWRYQVVLNGFAVSLPAQQLPKLSRQSFAARVWPSYTYHLATEPQPRRDRRRRLPRCDQRERRGRQDRRRRRRHRQHESLPERRRLHAAVRLPDWPDAVHEREDHRRARVRRSRLRRQEQACPRPEGLVPRHSRRGHRSRRRGNVCACRRRPSAHLRALRRRAEGLPRQLPSLQPPDADRPHRRIARDREGVRADGHGRHGRDQLLRRRPASRASERRPDRGDEQRRGGGCRSRHLGGERPRRLRVRHGRLAGNRTRRDHGRGGLELARLRPRAGRVQLGRHGDPPPADPVARRHSRRLGELEPAARRHRHDRRDATASRSSAISAAVPPTRTARRISSPPTR